MFFVDPGSVGRQAHLNARCTPEEEAQKEVETRYICELGISQNGIKVDVPIIVYGFLMFFMVDDFFPLLMFFMIVVHGFILVYDGFAWFIMVYQHFPPYENGTPKVSPMLRQIQMSLIALV